jgi:hypothetical protein
VLLLGLELLTSTDDGDVRLPGLTITASADVVTVSGPAEQVLRSWSWSEVDALDTDGQEWGSDGRRRQVLELSAANRSHRFVVAAPDLSVFLTATAGWRHQASPPTGPVRGDTTAGGRRGGRRRERQKRRQPSRVRQQRWRQRREPCPPR